MLWKLWMWESHSFNIFSHCSACIQFCFTSLLQKELDKIRQHWNTHRIRPCKQSECPSGRPDTIFFLPSAFGKRISFLFLFRFLYHSFVLYFGSKSCLETPKAMVTRSNLLATTLFRRVESHPITL